MKCITMYKWWLIVKKQEMTKVWVNDTFVPVTLVKVIPQEIIRYKTDEKDWYTAAVVGTEKKTAKTKKGEKAVYNAISEFKVDVDYTQNNQVGKVLDLSTVEGIEYVDATWTSIGKGFQGMVKRCHIKGMPATHGHKFTRTGWSKGNRKPRRTMKWHPHAGHMGMEQITVKDIKVIDMFKRDNEEILVLKWSLPGAYNGTLKLKLH